MNGSTEIISMQIILPFIYLAIASASFGILSAKLTDKVEISNLTTIAIVFMGIFFKSITLSITQLSVAVNLIYVLITVIIALLIVNIYTYMTIDKKDKSKNDNEEVLEDDENKLVETTNEVVEDDENKSAETTNEENTKNSEEN